MNKLDRIFKEASVKAVMYSKKNLSVKLDFSEESLEELDEILEMFHLANKKDMLNDKKIIDISMMFGGYLGEVISKNIGGKWEENDYNEIFLNINGFRVLPLNIVYKRLNFGEKISIKDWYSKFKIKM